jgi:hypothetical protein
MQKTLTALTMTLCLAAPDTSRAAGATEVAEIERFRLNDGVTDAAFLDATRAMQPAVEAAPGFLSRRLSKGEDGIWTDHVTWSDLTSALTAAEEVFKHPAAQAFGAMIAPGSIDMRHEPLLFQME